MEKTSRQLLFLALLSMPILLACSLSSNEEEIKVNCDFELYPPSDTIITSHNEWTQTHYKERISEFKKDSIYPGSIVMLGNSLTEQGEDWSKLLDIERVKNRGIAGDNADGLSVRLGEIICASPKSVFIMIGTNDLWINYSVKEVGANINGIADSLAEALPKTEVYLQTIMPLGNNHDKADRLQEINQELRSFNNRKYKLIDTFESMANEDGYLNSNLTTDGVHLTSAGYEKWAEFLRTFVR